VQPAEMVGYHFESEEMVSEMVEHLQSTPGALPLLQFTAFQLWQKRDAARKTLTKQSYDALGGIAGALATHADQVVQKQTPDAQMMCRALFLQLVTPERTRAIREVSELYDLVTDKEMLQKVLNDLVDERLLVLNTGGGGGGATVEIIHESLIEAWRTLRHWLEESHEDSMFLEQLRAAARQWAAKKKDSGLLWTGEMAEELFRFRKRFKGELSDTVGAFADAVHHHLQRKARFKRLAAITGVGLLLALLAAAVVALVIISRSQEVAEQSALTAKKAEGVAQQSLLNLQEKELARKLEAEKRAQAESEVKAANTTIDKTQGELAQRNAELERSLSRTEEQKQLAMEAQRDAERKAQKARTAEARTKRLLRREKARADRLNKQLGSPVVEVLK